MTIGKVTKLVRTFGSTWGRVRADRGSREVFFNLASLIDPANFARLAEGDAVEFEEEPERADSVHAVRMRLIPFPHGEDNGVVLPLAKQQLGTRL